jgi:hypothetical protein
VSPAAPRVLCYSPYTRWGLHGQWEMTLLQGLRQAGAEVAYVLCDGMFTDCDLHWEATDPRPANACAGCQAGQAGLAAQLGMDFRWLGRSAAADDRRIARDWVAALGAGELLGARSGAWEIGRWVRGSVHSHFRRSELDPADPAVERVLRSYLFSGLVAALALDRLLADEQPDVLLVFNGRQSSTRVALELARARGIRVVTHERGPRRETLSLVHGASAVALAPVHRLWDEWGDVPLSEDELARLRRHLAEREHGVGLGWSAFTDAPQDPDAVRASLGLDPAKATWVLFTSSDDEVVSEPEWQGPFASQLAWIERTLRYVARHREIELVIRVHPNTGSKRSLGRNASQLAELEALREALPANARMVAADAEVSSYTLMDLATAGLVYHSSAGLELAAKGKATVVAAGSPVSGLPFVRTVRDAAGYEGVLGELRGIAPGTVDAGIRRGAWRFAYARLFRAPVPFPLVRQRSAVHGEPLWHAPEELGPGADAGLDRAVRIVLDGAPVCAPPGAAERARAPEPAGAYGDGPGAPAPRFTAVAFAGELVEDARLLRVWGRAFGAEDPATLVIHTPPDATAALVAAVERAGLEGDGAPDLVAVAPAEGPEAHAVLSGREPAGTLAALPRFDGGSPAALRAFAAARLG